MRGRRSRGLHEWAATTNSHIWKIRECTSIPWTPHMSHCGLYVRTIRRNPAPPDSSRCVALCRVLIRKAGINEKGSPSSLPPDQETIDHARSEVRRNCFLVSELVHANYLRDGKLRLSECFAGPSGFGFDFLRGKASFSLSRPFSCWRRPSRALIFVRRVPAHVLHAIFGAAIT